MSSELPSSSTSSVSPSSIVSTEPGLLGGGLGLGAGVFGVGALGSLDGAGASCSSSSS